MKRFFVMLTFDLEEFDIPEEYGLEVAESVQIDVTRAGLGRLTSLLDRYDIPATFFTTANFALKASDAVKGLHARHEIASHAFYHSPSHVFDETDISESKRVLEEISGRKVIGFRMPRLKPFDPEKLAASGLLYDASVNPVFLPGRYNLLHKKPVPHRIGSLMEIPCSATPLIRFPLFWLSFKNLPAWLYNPLCRWTLSRRENLMLYFHPWEFADIGMYRLPAYIRQPDGARLLAKLETLIKFLSDHGSRFVTAAEYFRYVTGDAASAVKP